MLGPGVQGLGIMARLNQDVTHSMDPFHSFRLVTKHECSDVPEGDMGILRNF